MNAPLKYLKELPKMFEENQKAEFLGTGKKYKSLVMKV